MSLINQIIWEESDEYRQAVANLLAEGFWEAVGDGVAGLSCYLQERESCWG
jgi:hypothetical protein